MSDAITHQTLQIAVDVGDNVRASPDALSPQREVDVLADIVCVELDSQTRTKSFALEASLYSAQEIIVTLPSDIVEQLVLAAEKTTP